MNDYVIEKLGEKVAKRFSIWAFGKGYLEKTPLECADYFNEKHGDLYLINKNNPITKDLDKMFEIYLNLKKKKKKDD